ncbi:alpha/beta hydrolase family protein [Polaribacter uvawellassae]|uniref:alpha/beta hydrolase family protein n=1 Tax=Polaribacter uvawellassae TaxID=3133495 RepID=UPI003219BD0B
MIFIQKIFKPIFTTIVFFVSLSLTAQNVAESNLKTVPVDDYGKWERINWGTSFSNDGNWLQYVKVNNESDKTLFIVNTKTKKAKEINNAEFARFSVNSKWLAYAKVLSGKASKKSKKKAPNKLGVLNLITNDSLEFLDVVNYKFSGSGSYLAMKRQKNKSNTLIVKNLETGLEVTFGNVKEYAWQDKGTLLAMLINTTDKVGNGIQLYNAITGNLKVLNQKEEIYSGLEWRKESSDLFVTRKNIDKNYKESSNDLLYWKNLDSNFSFKIFDQSSFSNFPKDTKIINRNIRFSDDGNIVYFNTEYRKPNDKKKEDDKKIKSITDDDEAPALEIWNSSDAVIIPAQKMNSRFGFKLAAWNVSNNSFYKIENDLVERIRLQTDTNSSIGQDQTPYEFDGMFGRPSSDLYVVNNKNGNRKKVVTKANRYWSISPNNQYFVYLNNDHLHLYNIKNETSSNITSNIKDQFIDVENDHPTPQKPAFGFVAWSSDSKSYFINSEYDVWQIFTNGSKPKRVTQGKEKGVIYRFYNFDREQQYIDVKKPVYFSMRNKLTKASGLASGKLGKKINTLIFKEASISSFIKAKESNNFAFVEQTYMQSPNLFISNSTSFKSPTQVSNTNIFQKDYAWGKAELITFTNALGKQAQGILYYPADYKKGKKYPMITYIYEKLTQNFHRYISPSRTNYYNTTVWTQNGYFVLNPDIEFIAGDPGISSAKTLESAVKAVVNKGDVDAKRVGLIGHSWGGYQAAFVPTQTNIFAASVAGAGLTELISMNLAVTPAFGGMPENAHFEVSQERMEVAPWVSPERYLRNSPVMNIETLNTPMLFEVGDNDTNVNWFQGIAYYNAARRAKKPFVLLVYAKEGHGLRQDKNRIDYQQRILTWFGHYLKDEKAEDWVLKGIPYAEQQRRLKKKK